MGTAWGFGGASRDRTGDLYNAIVALSQLSYGPTLEARKNSVCTRGASSATRVREAGGSLQGIEFIRDLACVMLVAGVVIGPHVPWKLLSDQRTMQSIADLGVVLLMFTIGLDFNLRKLRALGAGVMLAALAEVGLMLWIGIEIGRLAGWKPIDTLFL